MAVIVRSVFQRLLADVAPDQAECPHASQLTPDLIQVAMKEPEYVKRFRVDKPEGFSLTAFDPRDTSGFNRSEADAELLKLIDRLVDLQLRLYAEHSWAVLVILQGVDAAGKDSAIRHVMSRFNPLGCHAHSFKAPEPHELDHDFLWRAALRLPARGQVGVFNRSYYEEVLTVRVHRDLLANERLPARLVTKTIWAERFEDINAFERHLARNGTVIIKFHLFISKEEQKRRLLARLDDPAKRWKFSMDDVTDHLLWDHHMDTYVDMVRNTSTHDAPWYVVPADHKWFAHLVVAKVMVDVLDGLDLKFPNAGKAVSSDFAQIRRALSDQ
jgi:PPK2 family polyphosphate:nucleotide phosphotransferase